MKVKHRHLGIKWNLFLSFILFSMVLIVLLWLFQIVFLDDFYKAIKKSSVQNSSETIASNIENNDLQSLLNRLAEGNDLNVMILNKTGQQLLMAENTKQNPINFISPDQIKTFMTEAQNAGGQILYEFDMGDIKNSDYKPDQFEGHVPAPAEGPITSIVNVTPVVLTDGSQQFIVISAVLTPISSTVKTLQTQLQFITLILVVLSLGLALIMSRRVARPIVSINDRAKEMAKGNYDVTFKAAGYKEITELADTLNITALELNKVETLRRELIANVSHDLRTPPTMISGYAEVMRDLPGENNPENVQDIIDEALRLNSLVNSLFDLSKVQNGNQKLNRKKYSMTASIRSILERYTKLIDQEGYKLTFEATDEAWINADEQRIEQVLYNLINNAISYTGQDKTVKVQQKITDGWVRIEIVDSGDGISTDRLPHIWDCYYKGDKTHRRAVVGTGLGLSIVKGALDLHHADYGVDSNETGSVFWFRLPTANPEVV